MDLTLMLALLEHDGAGEIRDWPGRAYIAREMALDGVGDIEDEFVAARRAADLQREGRAGRLEAARNRDARMTGQGERIGRRQPGEVGWQCLAVDRLDIELLERKGRHRN